jgi:hypothetical protein
VAAERIVTVVILAVPAVVAVGRAVLRAVEELLAKGTPVVWVLMRPRLIFRLVLVAVVALAPVAGRHMRTGLLQLGVQVALVLHHP